MWVTHPLEFEVCPESSGLALSVAEITGTVLRSSPTSCRVCTLGPRADTENGAVEGAEMPRRVPVLQELWVHEGVQGALSRGGHLSREAVFRRHQAMFIPNK